MGVMLGQSTPVKSFQSHAINDPKLVDTRADRQLMTREHYYLILIDFAIVSKNNDI